MKKGVAIAGSSGFVEGAARLDTATLMAKVGRNIGNLVFQYACYNLIDEEKYILGQDIPWNVSAVRERCRAIIVPSANFIREGFDCTGIANFLEKVDLPVVFLGLGAQSVDTKKTNFDLHPSVRRLVSVMSERSPSISVRGNYTAEVLHDLGVDNVVATGCPSNFLNPSPDLPEMIQSKLKAGMRTFVVAASDPWNRDPIKKRVERRLAQWCFENPSFMVQQSPEPFIRYIRRANPHTEGFPLEEKENSVKRAMLPNVTMEQFREFMFLKFRAYFSVDHWLEDVSKADFSLGQRLHGNMAAWQAGTPSLWIYHDSRTKELVELMGLPRIAISQFEEKCETVDQAFEALEFDSGRYRERRADLAGRLIGVLESASLSYSPFLDEISGRSRNALR